MKQLLVDYSLIGHGRRIALTLLKGGRGWVAGIGFAAGAGPRVKVPPKKRPLHLATGVRWRPGHEVMSLERPTPRTRPAP